MHANRLKTARPRRLRKLAIVALLLLIGGSATAGTYVWLTKANLYTFEVRRGDEVISRSRILVKRGQTATIIVEKGIDDPDSVAVHIFYDGSFTVIGPPDAVV
ncbi:MAG: hypothetical protein IIC60_15170, partial [Proteobacteria bacterium]|nr:hypothetical protein [Pseudomonadota bacterium]